MRILIVKTSSMGDVVHALPVVHDIRRAFPNIEIEWLVGVVVRRHRAHAPRREPGAAAELAPLAAQAARSRHLARDARTAGATARAAVRLRARPAGLVQERDVGTRRRPARWSATTAPSGRDPIAPWLYVRKAAVSLQLHAVDRCRRLAAVHLGYPVPADPPVFGIRAGESVWKVRGGPSAALIPCASRPEKIWPEARWIAVGRRIKAMGLSPLVIWGTEEEQVRAERIAAGCEGEVPPFLNVHDMAALLARHQARHRSGHRLLASGRCARPADASASIATTSRAWPASSAPAAWPASAARARCRRCSRCWPWWSSSARCLDAASVRPHRP